MLHRLAHVASPGVPNLPILNAGTQFGRLPHRNCNSSPAALVKSRIVRRAVSVAFGSESVWTVKGRKEYFIGRERLIPPLPYDTFQNRISK